MHGSAPDIAGKDLANPLALIFSAVMMLEHLATSRKDPACAQAAARIDKACRKALEEGDKTRDLKGSLGTREFARAIVARL